MSSLDTYLILILLTVKCFLTQQTDLPGRTPCKALSLLFFPRNDDIPTKKAVTSAYLHENTKRRLTVG